MATYVAAARMLAEPSACLFSRKMVGPSKFTTRVFARNITPRPYSADKPPNSKTAATSPTNTHSTGFKAIGSYNTIARRWVTRLSS